MLVKVSMEKDVVVISSIDWDWKWQGPQEIAVRLARSSNRVLFVENPGVRSIKAGDAPRVMRRLRKAVSSLRRSVREVQPGVFVCTPMVLPPFGSRVRRWLNSLLLWLSVGRASRQLRLDASLVFVCLPTDVSLRMTRMLKSRNSVLVYYAISDLIEMTDHPTEMAAIENRLIGDADLVFTTYLPLVERYGIQRDNIHLLPYGVNLDRFPLTGSARRPWNPPVVGYVGGISQHFDTELISEVARRRPTWNIALIGPEQTGGEGLPDLDNIHLLGHVAHTELPEWIRGFDVCLIPYRRSRYTDTVYPVKLNEYLALGRGVVSVDLPALVGHEEPGVLSLSPPDPDAFIRAIESMFPVADDPKLVARRRNLAESHDWVARVEEMRRLIETVRTR